MRVRRVFMLIEPFLVIATVTVLIALLPALRAARESASDLASTGGARRYPLDRREHRVRTPERASPGTAARVDEPDDEALAARWEALSARFLQEAAPLVEAFRRVDRLAEELPERLSAARDAEAAYLSARRAREAAEAQEATYLETAGSEERAARDQAAVAETNAGRARAKLDDVLRSRERVTAAWAAQGGARRSAEDAATVLFDKDVKIAENGLRRALLVSHEAKGRLDLIVRFEQARQAMALRAEVEARRAHELACQAAWERAKSKVSQIKARIARSDLSLGERRLLDRLLVVVRASGPWPPSYGDRADRRAFLDRFEAQLDSAMVVARRFSAERYDDLIARLSRANGGTGGGDLANGGDGVQQPRGGRLGGDDARLTRGAGPPPEDGP